MISPTLIFLVSLLLLLTFLMLIQTRVSHLITLYIFQNIILIIYMVHKAFLNPNMELSVSIGITFFIKLIFLPIMLWKLNSYLKFSERIDPFIKKSTLQLMGIVLIVFILLIMHPLKSTLSQASVSSFSLLLANCALSLLLIIFRQKAISQVIGLLVLENSIFILSLSLNNGFPWIVEFGIAFDLLMACMIFGLFLLRIRSTYGSLHIHHLEKLKER